MSSSPPPNSHLDLSTASSRVVGLLLERGTFSEDFQRNACRLLDLEDFSGFP